MVYPEAGPTENSMYLLRSTAPVNVFELVVAPIGHSDARKLPELDVEVTLTLVRSVALTFNAGVAVSVDAVPAFAEIL
ncbi:hypothetical protein GCM10027048_04480 [Hymenobacter coalescens]